MAGRIMSLNLLPKAKCFLPVKLSPLLVGAHWMQKRQDFFHTNKPMCKLENVKVTFVQQDGSKHEAKGKEGDNLLDIIVNENVDIDGFGACEGTLACSTCHVIFKQDDFDRLTEEATDEELDMLDLAYGLTDTSRLGCQVCISKELSGIEVQIPEGVNDQR